MVTAFNIVYNTVINFTALQIAARSIFANAARGGHRRKTSTREDDGRKNSQTRQRSSAKIS
jgi:hypothetical protein